MILFSREVWLSLLRPLICVWWCAECKNRTRPQQPLGLEVLLRIPIHAMNFWNWSARGFRRVLIYYSSSKNRLNPIRLKIFFSKFQKNLNWKNRVPSRINKSWYTGKTIKTRRIQYQRSPQKRVWKFSRLICRNSKTGLAKRTLKEPVSPKTINMTTNCLLDSMPHFNFSRSKYKLLLFK